MTSKKPDRERRYADGRGTVLFGESHCSITVDRLMDMDTRKVKPPTVRWGPLSFSIEDADQFLADLTDAIEYARAWAKETGNG